MGAYLNTAIWFTVMVWCPVSVTMIVTQAVRCHPNMEPDIDTYVDYLETKYGFHNLVGIVYRS
jgi:hypothetical protein